jgi:hypothetical protein
MTGNRRHRILQQLQAFLARSEIQELTDGQLLEVFVSGGQEAALGALAQRRGGPVSIRADERRDVAGAGYCGR